MKKNTKVIKGLRNSIEQIKEDMFIGVSNSKVNKKKYMVKLPCLVEYNKDNG